MQSPTTFPNNHRTAGRTALKFCIADGAGPLQNDMVAWTGLDHSNDWVYVFNRHFLDSIFDLFFTGHSWNRHANQELKYYFFLFFF